MPNLKSSLNFVRIEGVPEIAGGSTVREVFQNLSNKGVSGFVLTEHDHPVSYINAATLAKSIEDQHRNQDVPWEGVSSQKIEIILKDYPVAEIKIGRASAAEEPENLEPLDDQAFIVKEEGNNIGLFLKGNLLHETVNTPAPVWICAKGHENPDSDDGYCYKCPRPVYIKK